MFLIICTLLSGLLLGYLLRKQNIKGIHKVITVLIWTLLFLLGTEVGGNKILVNALPRLGMEAVAITLGALSGSILAAWALWRWIYSKKKEPKR